MYVPTIVKKGRWMEVARSGFYEWRNAPESATAKRRGILALIVTKSFDESDGTYGYRRGHTDPVAWGGAAGARGRAVGGAAVGPGARPPAPPPGAPLYHRLP